MPLRKSILKLANIFFAVRPCHSALPMHIAILELTDIFSPVRPCHSALPIHYAILELTHNYSCSFLIFFILTIQTCKDPDKSAISGIVAKISVHQSGLTPPFFRLLYKKKTIYRLPTGVANFIDLINFI
jgi:hypothetical protein